MNDDMMNLRPLVERSPPTPCCARSACRIAVDGAGRRQPNSRWLWREASEWLEQRHGYRDREIRADTVELRVPELRRGSCFSGLSWSRPDGRNALTVAYLRRLDLLVDDLVEAMGMSVMG